MARWSSAVLADVSEQVEQALAGPDAEAFERLRAHVRAVAAHALRTFELLEDLFTACLEKAQRHGDIDPDADPRALAGLLLAVLRGIEALGKAGKSEASLHSIAETALAALPRAARPHTSLTVEVCDL